MFRPIRRKEREIDLTATRQLLHSSRRGVLAVHGDDGYPYAVPVNYVYDEARDCIYFHGAKAGHKVDAITACDKVCFTVYGNERVKETPWAPYLQSAVVFGRCRLLSPGPEANAHLQQLAIKYYPNAQLVTEEMEKHGKTVQMFEIQIEHITGKEIQEK